MGDYTSEIDEANKKQEKAFTSYLDQLTDLNKQAQEELNATKADQEALDKRNRSRSIINGISDGLTAIANLYATTKGAPSAQLASLSANQQNRYMQERARLDALRRENMSRIDALRDRSNHGALSLSNMQYNNAIRLAGVKRQAELEDKQQERADESLAIQKKSAEDLAAYNFERAKALQQQADVDNRKLENEKAKAKAKIFRDTWGEEIPFNLGSETIKIGKKALENQMKSLCQDIWDDAQKDYNTQKAALQDEKKKGNLTKALYKSQLQDLDRQFNDKKLAHMGLIENNPNAIMAFAYRYIKDSPTAINRLISISKKYDDAKAGINIEGPQSEGQQENGEENDGFIEDTNEFFD